MLNLVRKKSAAGFSLRRENVNKTVLISANRPNTKRNAGDKATHTDTQRVLSLAENVNHAVIIPDSHLSALFMKPVSS